MKSFRQPNCVCKISAALLTAWLIALSAPSPAIAGQGSDFCPAASAGRTAGTVEIILASLSPAEPAESSRNMSVRDDSGQSEEIQIAGQCGSSNEYCEEPSPYCCGNSTDGFYCAKDVNGCNR